MPVWLIHDMFIYLIGDNKGIISLRKICNDLQFVIGEHFATGIGGVAEDQCFGMLPKGRLQLIRVEVEFRWIQGHINWFRTGEDCIGTVILIER